MVRNSLAPSGWTSESDLAPGTENFLGALSHGLALPAVAFLLLFEAIALLETPSRLEGSLSPPLKPHHIVSDAMSHLFLELSQLRA